MDAFKQCTRPVLLLSDADTGSPDRDLKNNGILSYATLRWLLGLCHCQQLELQVSKPEAAHNEITDPRGCS